MSEESSNPDSEILAALRPTLATTGGPLIVISSPYARRGEVWQTYHKHFGPDGDPAILVAQGESRLFNPTLPQTVVDRAYERDPAAASAEYGAEFRSDVEAFVSRDVVEACVDTGVFERPPVAKITYAGFVDPSGGSADAMTLAVGHREDDAIVFDAVRERRPTFSPEAVVLEFADTLKRYWVSKVLGDRYAGAWPIEAAARHDIDYEPAAKPKSDLYRDSLPTLNSGKARLLDLPKLVSQLSSLERRTSRGGRDSIDHPPRQHDDPANAVAGLAQLLADNQGYDDSLAWAAALGQLLQPADVKRANWQMYWSQYPVW